MATLIYYAVMIVISLVMAHQASKTKMQSKTPNLDIDENTFPVATEDKHYQLVYGTALLESINCTWYSDLSAFPITEKVKQGGLFGSKKKKVTVAYGYRAGVKLALGYGEMNLRELRFEDRAFFKTKKDGKLNFEISFHRKNSSGINVIDTSSDYRNFFGDYKAEGGIEGKIYFHNGKIDDEYIPPYLLRNINEDYIYPNKGQAYILLENFYYGNSKTLKKLSAVVNRIPTFNFLNKNYDSIDGDCNPVNIICDLLLNFGNGAGLEIDELDIPSFVDVQKKLYDEKFGQSFILNNDSIINNVITDILERIDAVLYTNNQNGRTGIKLNRKPKDYKDKLVIDDSLIINYSSITKNSPSTLINQLKLTYVDKEKDFKKKVISYSNEANYNETKEVISKSITMESVTNINLAKRLIIREIKPLTKNYYKCEVITNRKCRSLRSGDVVIFNSKKYNINNLPMRVLEIDLGNAENSEIKLTLIEDLYGEMDYGLSLSMENPEVQEEGKLELFDYLIIDAPFLVSELSLEDVRYNYQDQMVLAKQPNKTTVTYTVIDEQGEIDQENITFTNVLKVTNNTSRNAEEIEYDGYFIPQDLASNLALIVNSQKQQELINFKGFDLNNHKLLNVERGCDDTLPMRLNAGDEIYLLGDNYGTLINETHIAGSTKRYKLLPAVFNKTLNSEDVPMTTFLISNRASLPLMVSRVSVNNSIVVKDDNIVINGVLNLKFTYKEKSKTKTNPYFSLGDEKAPDGIKTEITIRRSNGTIFKQENVAMGNYTLDFEYNKGIFEIELVNIDSSGKRSINNPKFKITNN